MDFPNENDYLIGLSETCVIDNCTLHVLQTMVELRGFGPHVHMPDLYSSPTCISRQLLLR